MMILQGVTLVLRVHRTPIVEFLDDKARVMNVHKHVSGDDILDYVFKYRYHYGFNSKHNLGGMCDYLKRSESFTLISHVILPLKFELELQENYLHDLQLLTR